MASENTIFICYRRQDSETEVVQIHGFLKARFGAKAVFLDQQGFEGGDEWRARTRELISKAKAVIVVLGKDWIKIGRNSLNDPNDPVRLELQLAFENPNCAVIPVIVENPSHPIETRFSDSELTTFLMGEEVPDLKAILSQLNEKVRIRLRVGHDFSHDVKKLARGLKQVLRRHWLPRVVLSMLCLFFAILLLSMLLKSPIKHAPNPEWLQANTKLLLMELPEHGRHYPKVFVDGVASGPPWSDDERKRIQEMRQQHGADDLPGFVLYASELKSDYTLAAHLDLRAVRRMVLGCEWWSSSGERISLRDKSILFPEDLDDPKFGQFDFQVPDLSDATPAQPGRTHGWIVIWAIPLDSISDLGDPVSFDPPNETIPSLKVRPPWIFSVRLQGE